MADRSGESARTDVPRPDAPRTGALARAVAGPPGLVQRPSGHRARTRPAHGRHVVGRLSAGWSPGAGLCANGWRPPALNAAQQAALKAAVQRPPREAGIDVATWHWKAVRRFVAKRFGITLARSTCLTYLHRLGFVVKRPIKRLLKADETKRAAFVAAYATLRQEAQT